MKIVIYQDYDGKWKYDKDSLIEKGNFDDYLDWLVGYYTRYKTPRQAKIVEIPDLPDPNTLA